MIDEGDLLWQDNLTHCSCQVWWRHTYFWPMILHTKKICCKDIRNELKKLSQQDRVIKFCTDAGFLTTVEVGQCFMTKDTEEFLQFTDSVACHEYTSPRDEHLSDLKGWIRVNTKIGLVLEVTTCCLQGKYGVEIRIKSVNKDNSHSWVRISHGLNKLVTSRKPQRCSSKTVLWNRMHVLLRADQRLKQNHKDVFLPAHSQKLYLLGKNLDRYWTTRLFAHRILSVEETDQSSSSW